MLLLDTNSLYYITGVEKKTPPNLDVNKMISEIRHHQRYITELNVLEVCTHYKDDILKIQTLVGEMIKLDIGIIKYPHTINTRKKEKLFEQDIRLIYQNLDELKEFIKNALELRIKIESQFLLFWASNIASLYLATEFTENGAMIENVPIIFNTNLVCLALLITNEDEMFSMDLKEKLHQFYHDEKSINLKDLIVEFVLSICKYYLEMYYVSLNNCYYIDYFCNIDDYNETIKKDVSLKLVNDPYYKRLEKREEEKKILIPEQLRKILENNLSHYEVKMNRNFHPIVINYYKELFLTFYSEMAKINKNDVIDSLLLNYYPNITILTFDNKLLNFIKQFNPEYYERIEEIKKKCFP
ncbi:hypothetical protein FACS189485_05430 [Spirochaetia bacterium]|nr:hypothetical protein FACS189485_05430 [Spirochaetia bacterium]